MAASQAVPEAPDDDTLVGGAQIARWAPCPTAQSHLDDGPGASPGAAKPYSVRSGERFDDQLV